MGQHQVEMEEELELVIIEKELTNSEKIILLIKKIELLKKVKYGS